MAVMGRPTKYTQKLADEICDAVASTSVGLQALCEQNPHWPARSNIFIWLRRHDYFRDKYALAKLQQTDVSVDYMQEMMNESHHYIDEFGKLRIDTGMLRLKMDAIKWQASKLNPKVYGDAKTEAKEGDVSVLEKILKGEIVVK